MISTKWNGKGFPPVGCKVIVSRNYKGVNDRFSQFLGKEVTIVAHFEHIDGIKEIPSCVISHPHLGHHSISTFDYFFPIRSDRDIAIDEMQEISEQSIMPGAGRVELMILCNALYDAGYRKVIK